jgi:hypothetical protein
MRYRLRTLMIVASIFLIVLKTVLWIDADIHSGGPRPPPPEEIMVLSRLLTPGKVVTFTVFGDRRGRAPERALIVGFSTAFYTVLFSVALLAVFRMLGNPKITGMIMRHRFLTLMIVLAIVALVFVTWACWFVWWLGPIGWIYVGIAGAMLLLVVTVAFLAFLLLDQNIRP